MADRSEIEVERLEDDLNRLIERRAEKAKDDEEKNERWVSSVKRFHQSNAREICEAQVEFHTRQAQSHRATLGALVDYHERERDKYLSMLKGGNLPQGDLGLRPGRAEIW